MSAPTPTTSRTHWECARLVMCLGARAASQGTLTRVPSVSVVVRIWGTMGLVYVQLVSLSIRNP